MSKIGSRYGALFFWPFYIINSMEQVYSKRTYLAIDLKSFYASVECVKRGLDPLAARLVVADESRTEKTICLAVSPALKALDISGRARLFEVYEKAPRGSFIIAKPAMADYLQVSSEIFAILPPKIFTSTLSMRLFLTLLVIFAPMRWMPNSSRAPLLRMS